MNDDELKNLWQQQPLRDPDPSAEKLVCAMKNKMTGFRGILEARDLGELVACAAVIIIFGVFYFTAYRTPISRLGDLIVIGGALFIAFKLVYARWTTPPAPSGATVVESLRAELNSARTQSRLLGSVLWWYILPLFVGVTVATWGLSIDPYTKVFCTLFFIAIDVWIYRLNRRAVSEQILPLEAQLEALLHSAESGEPLDETKVAELRPIAVSMAAAENVKPVEFNVAFWQLAVFGMPGIVGIWFFWMVEQTLDNGSKAQISKTFAQPVLAVETNRYAVVARKVSDLFNAGEYAAVQKLYNPKMSKAFPLKETSAFYTRLAANFGNIEQVEGPWGKSNAGWVAFGLHCTRGELTMSLALDEKAEISGIYFAPTQKLSRNIESFIVGFFGWQHLLWFVPFFLGGLLYSWVFYKRLERAVGISAVGIHLNKGLNLILWDEIKEIQSFRFMHIRNLSLITGTGEKTRMHWTPLERHADLKAAVETFAPASHPIRNYLSLLK